MRPNRLTLLALFVALAAGASRAEGAAPALPTAAAPAQPGPAAAPAGNKPAPAAERSAPAVAAGGESDADATVAIDEPVLADAPDEPAIREEIDQESAELEDLRQAEGASKVQDLPAVRRAVGIVDGLGLESPLRDRVGGALEREVAARAGEGGRIALLPELDRDLEALQAEYDIPIDVNEAVLGYIRFFQSSAARRHFVKWLGRSHKYLERYREILREEGLPEDTVYLAMIESGFGNFAYSRARASGPWQFIPPTGKYYGLQQDFWVDQRRDPERSARAAARYLKKLREQTGDWRLAWAGYNAGVGRIFGAKKRGYTDFWAMAATAEKGRKAILRPETKGYVPKLMAAAIIAKHPEAFGFSPDEIEPQAWTHYDEVTIPNATLLSVIARAAAVSERELIDLNPELRRTCTPPRSYQLKVPKTAAEQFARTWPAIQSQVRLTFAGHVIRKGDTLSAIATRYGVPVQGILEMNGLKGAKKLRVGTELLIPKPVGGSAAVAAREGAAAPRRAGDAPSAVRVAAASREEPAAAPAPSRRAEASAAKQTLRVRAGDTLWSISQRLGVELQELCRWNGIRNPHRHKLLVGAMLVVRERG
jgi:membrane-bound lytic murein transglycosylase D